MSKQAEENATEKVTSQIEKSGFTINKEFAQMIAIAVAAAVKEASRDEEKEISKARAEADRERVRAEEMQRIQAIAARQASCPHLDSYENYAFVGQRNCMGQLVFICSQCFHPFKPGDVDYMNFVRFVKLDRIGNARQI